MIFENPSKFRVSASSSDELGLEANDQIKRKSMKNQNKANACRTQIADISVAGKELSEEHLRIVGGGLPIFGGTIVVATAKTTYAATCVRHFDQPGCIRYDQDAADCGTDSLYW